MAVILVPFVLLDRSIEQLSNALLASHQLDDLRYALLIAALLSADVFLPVPSSLVSAAAGIRLGLLHGALASWVGMTGGCLVGYYVGRSFGRDISQRIVGQAGWENASRGISRAGVWTVLLARPVPALAEATVLAAGSAGMPFVPFVLASGTANLAVSAVYAFAGAQGLESGSFLLALAAACVLPALGWASTKAIRLFAR